MVLVTVGPGKVFNKYIANKLWRQYYNRIASQVQPTAGAGPPGINSVTQRGFNLQQTLNESAIDRISQFRCQRYRRFTRKWVKRDRECALRSKCAINLIELEDNAVDAV